jgi:Zn-dependent peptidase ImmA (M78 family)
MNFFSGPRNWVIEEVSESWFKKNIDNSSNYGWCDEETATIYIIKNKKSSEEFKNIVIKHEIIHAWLFALGIRSHDEKLIDGLAHMWEQYENTKHD